MRIILASQSPRRREILASLGIRFEVVVSDAEERMPEGPVHPVALSTRLATQKALAVKERLEREGRWDDDTLIIAADTIVYCEDEVLGKPRDTEDAKRMLRKLSDTEHFVYSGACLLLGSKSASVADRTSVSFAPLDEEQIEWYVASGEPMDKAGAYAVQGLASMWINGLGGDYFNVVGLPVRAISVLLESSFGIKMHELCDTSACV